jgi:ribonuclease R
VAGDLAFCEVEPGRRLGLPRARVAERLGREDDPRAVSLTAAFAYGLPIAFDPEAVAEARAAVPVELGERTDLRDLDLVTIDGADARDFDDAVFARPDPDPANRGGLEVVVAIADVAHYVRDGSALDHEALRRGNSVYFPDRVLPMLPEALSNDLCSLRPDEDRACMAVRMTLDSDGNLIRHRFVRGLMRSRARLTYEQVQAAIEGDPDEVTLPLMDRVVRPLYDAFQALNEARIQRGTIDLDLPEYQVMLGEDGAPVDVKRRERLDAHRLIEEMMIAANVAAAETLERRRMPCMYRVHDRPDPVKVEALAQFLDALGVPCKAHGLRRPPDFAKLLRRMEDHELGPMVSGFVLRSQAQANYSPDNLGHFGLNLQRYAHFTSPIRRYADLLVHRALIRTLGLGEDGFREVPRTDDFKETGGHISRTERRAMEAERQAVQRFVSLFMAERVGTELPGRVVAVQPFGLFVALDDSGAEGLVPVSTLGLDYFDHDARHQALIGRDTRETFGLGDAVRVVLEQVDIATGQLQFRVTDHKEGPAARHAREAHKGRRHPPPKGRRFRRR